MCAPLLDISENTCPCERMPMWVEAKCQRRCYAALVLQRAERCSVFHIDFLHQGCSTVRLRCSSMEICRPPFCLSLPAHAWGKQEGIWKGDQPAHSPTAGPELLASAPDWRLAGMRDPGMDVPVWVLSHLH